MSNIVGPGPVHSVCPKLTPPTRHNLTFRFVGLARVFSDRLFLGLLLLVNAFH